MRRRSVVSGAIKKRGRGVHLIVLSWAVVLPRLRSRHENKQGLHASLRGVSPFLPTPPLHVVSWRSSRSWSFLFIFYFVTMSDSLSSENSAGMGSSPQSTQEPTVPASSEGDAPSNYAFYVHSKKTLTEDLPPKVDSKVYVRQRRRRTRYIFATRLFTLF